MQTNDVEFWSFLPSITHFFLRIIRLSVALVISMQIFNHFDAGDFFRRFYRETNAWISRLVIAPEVVSTIEKSADFPRQKTVKIITKQPLIRAHLRGDFYFNILIPGHLLLLFSLRPWRRTVTRLVIATLVIILFDGVLTYVHGVVHQNQIAQTNATREGINLSMEIVLTLLNFYILPIVALGAACLIVSVLPNKWMEPQPVSDSQKVLTRNQPCPCGSNKKYKHCCGH